MMKRPLPPALPPARGRSRHPARVPTCLVALLLAACGGGGSDGSEAAAGNGTAAASLDAAASGRAQALAFTLPPVQPAPAGIAGNVRCANLQLSAITVDNVEVPAGTAGHLAGTVVRGSVRVAPGGMLLAGSVTVAGSVQGDQAAHVQVTGSTSRITGDVQLEGGGSTLLQGLTVGGNVSVDGLADVARVRELRIGGNLQFIDNLGGGEIAGNRITGNLQCAGNLPAPLVGNNVAAAIEDQCRAGGASGGGGGGGGGGGTPPPAPPLTGNVTCVGLTVGALPLDSVIVPAGAQCTLLGTRLIGSIEVGAGARLIAEGVTVGGGVIADGATQVSVTGASLVGGSVQVQRGGSALLSGIGITGDLQIDAMNGPVVASGNRVGGNVQAMANRGGLALVDNTMTGAMQCKDNRPAPTGSGNRAAQKQDQCVGL